MQIREFGTANSGHTFSVAAPTGNSFSGVPRGAGAQFPLDIDQSFPLHLSRQSILAIQSITAPCELSRELYSRYTRSPATESPPEPTRCRKAARKPQQDRSGDAQQRSPRPKARVRSMRTPFRTIELERFQKTSPQLVLGQIFSNQFVNEGLELIPRSFPGRRSRSAGRTSHDPPVPAREIWLEQGSEVASMPANKSARLLVTGVSEISMDCVYLDDWMPWRRRDRHTALLETALHR